MLKSLALFWPIWGLLAVALVLIAVVGVRALYNGHQRKLERQHEMKMRQLDWDAHVAPFGHNFSQQELLVAFNDATELLAGVERDCESDPTLEISLSDLPAIRAFLEDLERAKHGLPPIERQAQQSAQQPQQRGQMG